MGHFYDMDKGLTWPEKQKSKKLLVISNHPVEGWSEEQKKGWDKIEYVPFPHVPPTGDPLDAVNFVQKAIKDFCLEDFDEDKYLCLQGDYYVTVKALIYLFRLEVYSFPTLVFPTTNRVVVETKSPDGTVTKQSLFKFKKWRVINDYPTRLGYHARKGA